MSDWAEVGSTPNETPASLTERILREGGTAALVLEPALAEARQLLEDNTIGLGPW